MSYIPGSIITPIPQLFSVSQKVGKDLLTTLGSSISIPAIRDESIAKDIAIR